MSDRSPPTCGSDTERLWEIIRTIIAERDAYAADRDRLAGDLAVLQMGRGAIPVLPAAPLAAAFTRIFPNCDHDQRIALFEGLLPAFAEYIHANGLFAKAAHDIGAAAGLTVMPLHY